MPRWLTGVVIIFAAWVNFKLNISWNAHTCACILGKCKILKEKTGIRCRDCRLKKCLQMGFPAVGQLAVMYEEDLREEQVPPSPGTL